jgi:hypothetical protein
LPQKFEDEIIPVLLCRRYGGGVLVALKSVKDTLRQQEILKVRLT